METQGLNITNEQLAALIQSRGMIVRAAQRVSFEEAMRAVQRIGTYATADFVIDGQNRFAYENAVRWCINDPEAWCVGKQGKAHRADPQKGLYVYGDTGTGKSLLLDICRTLCKVYGIGIKAGEKAVPLAWKTYRADDICDRVAEEGDLTPWKEEISLCIQDLGNEPSEVMYMGNRRRVLRSVLEARGDMYDRLTLISSNFPPERLGEVYGQRVASRIRQMCNPIYLGGSDRR